MRQLLLILALITALGSRAQLIDSIGLFLTEPPRPIVRLDLKGSFVSNHNVRLIGLKLGLEHARRFQYGLGYSFLYSPVVRDRNVEGEGLRSSRLRLGYAHVYTDYAFYQRGPWEVHIPVQLGFGSGSVVYEDATGRTRKLLRSGLILYEPSMTVQYRFLKFFGVGAGWGFRLVIRTGDDLGERLTAPIYSLGVRIFFGDLYKELQE